MGQRGFVCERWFGSETKADNPIGPADEGLAYLEIEGYNILLKDAVAACGETIMGTGYARTHKTAGWPKCSTTLAARSSTSTKWKRTRERWAATEQTKPTTFWMTWNWGRSRRPSSAYIPTLSGKSGKRKSCSPILRNGTAI